MSDRKYYLLENRVICSEFDSQLSIISNPYKYSKYIFMFLLYISAFIFYFYSLFNYKTINTLLNPLGAFAPFFYVPFIIFFTANYAPLVISVCRNTFFKNLFLKEQLIITKDRLIFKKYDKVKLNVLYEDIQGFSLDFQKSEKDFSGVPILVPNYKPILHLSLVSKKHGVKIFESIKRDEIKYLYDVITEKLIKNGLLFEENQPSERTSLNVFFLSPTKFYSSSKYLFEKTEIEEIDDNLASLKSEQGTYYSIVIEKFKENILKRRISNKISIY